MPRTNNQRKAKKRRRRGKKTSNVVCCLFVCRNQFEIFFAFGSWIAWWWGQRALFSPLEVSVYRDETLMTGGFHLVTTQTWLVVTAHCFQVNQLSSVPVVPEALHWVLSCSLQCDFSDVWCELNHHLHAIVSYVSCSLTSSAQKTHAALQTIRKLRTEEIL